MRKIITTKLPVNFYNEDNKFIAYCPALDISTCGDTFEEAQEKFEELVAIFLAETIKMDTLDDVLLECGWRKVSKPTPRWKPPIRRFITQLQEEVKLPCPA